MTRIPIALQMYTLREEAAKDFRGTLRRVAAIGYAGVELAGTGGLAATELKAVLDDLGLAVAGSHVGLDQLENNLAEVLRYNVALGNRYVVCPYLPEDRRKSAEDYRRLAERLNTIGRECKEAGLQLCYHNHAFEFERFDGRTGYDLLFGATDADLVAAEVDTYWAEYAGHDAADLIRRLSGRVPLIHLKDMAGKPQGAFAEVGEGVLDFAAIAAAAHAAGTHWFIVEQDVCARPPLESVEISLRNLRRMGLA
ncbi:MAG: sugar phosphate isomerase/epimerase family protein [Chthonomonadales bacterium]